MENIISHRGFAARGNFLAKVNGEFREAKGGKVGAFGYEILVKEDKEYRAYAVRLTNRSAETLRIGDIKLFNFTEDTAPAHERVIYRFTDTWVNNAVLKTSDENGAFFAGHLVPGDYTLRIPLQENEIIVDVIKCKFQSQGREVGDNDDIKREFEMFVTKIDYNVVR